jgi:hypothetical protein
LRELYARETQDSETVQEEMELAVALAAQKLNERVWCDVCEQFVLKYDWPQHAMIIHGYANPT